MKRWNGKTEKSKQEWISHSKRKHTFEMDTSHCWVIVAEVVFVISFWNVEWLNSWKKETRKNKEWTNEHASQTITSCSSILKLIEKCMSENSVRLDENVRCRSNKSFGMYRSIIKIIVSDGGLRTSLLQQWRENSTHCIRMVMTGRESEKET